MQQNPQHLSQNLLPQPSLKIVTANTPRPVESEIREFNTDVITPKSDNQGNTSDEGYCDYVSPGFEDHSRSSLTPVHSSMFQGTRTVEMLFMSYSVTLARQRLPPIFDDELDLTDSIVWPVQWASIVHVQLPMLEQRRILPHLWLRTLLVKSFCKVNGWGRIAY